MIGTRLWWTALAAAFVLVLLYATLRSIPAPVPGSGELDSSLAEEACRRAVRAEVTDARFPFAAKSGGVEDGRYRLQGTVDAGEGGGTIRRNYECVIRRTASGAHLVESLQLWQSH